MPELSFDTTLHQIKGHTILLLPLDVSQKLPSRGMVMAHASIDQIPLVAALEPDGRKSHWFFTSGNNGQTVSVCLTPIER
ncbi:MAG: hypothetical protein PWP24_1634 [Clostridiales bacterium]|nr:hypothetical protein [Clostridiales bacterium]